MGIGSLFSPDVLTENPFQKLISIKYTYSTYKIFLPKDFPIVYNLHVTTCSLMLYDDTDTLYFCLFCLFGVFPSIINEQCRNGVVFKLF